MPQVIIVSNRLPVSVSKKNGRLKFSPSIGGVATGLSSYLYKRKNRWIGWPGIASDELSDKDKQEITRELDKHNCTPVFLTQKQLDGFYNGYSNQVIWPLFHNLRRRNLSSPSKQQMWQAYRSVNQKFADTALNLSERGSHIWVQDYHLMLVPELVRNERPDVILGFFLHIPWPSPKSLAKLGEHKKIINGLLGADVIGFHTRGYVANFLESAQAAQLGQIGDGEVILDNRGVRVADFPMGIDYQKYATAAGSRSVKQAARHLHKLYKKYKLIVSIDRLDPSKGLMERLKAYSLLLEKYPALKGKVIFAMAVAPSRMDVPAYKNLSKRLQAEVDKINKKYGSRDWRPVDYINRTLSFEEVTALFQVADVAFITPLKDGMNLAAKEFVASRKRGGVLVLSETAGAAEELQDALLVNPHKPDTVVEALHKALTMRRRELRRRIRHMQHHLATNTVQDWATNFIGTLNRPVPGTGSRNLRSKLQLQIVNDYRQAEKRLLLLDYDGSLVGYSKDYRHAKPPKTLLDLLEKLGADPANDVVVISGRSSEDLEEWFGDLPINLVAEHGARLKKASGERWQSIEKIDSKWKEELQPILEKYINKTPGAKLEVKPHSLVWHYRNASAYYASKYAVTIKHVIRPLLKRRGLELMQGNKALEIKSSRVGKGIAAERWLKQGYDFILAIGDDVTDEDLFAVTPKSGPKIKSYSIKIGRGRSGAEFRLPSSDGAIKLLKQF